MSKRDWENVLANIKEQVAPETIFAGFSKFLTQDSMTLKEALNFIKTESEDKDAILKMLFGENKFEKFNFLPVSKLILPVNKANAVKSGTIAAKDLPETVDHITIEYKSSSMFKNNLLLLDILS